jgi:hypothetical protein
MTAHSTVAIDNDLAAGETRISLGPPTTKRPVGLMRNCVDPL